MNADICICICKESLYVIFIEKHISTKKEKKIKFAKKSCEKKCFNCHNVWL